jgi:hypothetical protein
MGKVKGKSSCGFSDCQEQNKTKEANPGLAGKAPLDLYHADGYSPTRNSVL